MRVPDRLRDCVVFLCAKQRVSGVEKLEVGGTGFLVHVEQDRVGHDYMLTAKHCIHEAERMDGYDGLFMKLNSSTGGTTVFPVKKEFHFSDDEGSDAAVLPIDWEGTAGPDFTVITEPSFATEDVICKHHIGCGDELLITGLFRGHYGKDRIRPIVRSGVIAAMPEEPMVDSSTGLPYHAYLVEVRSIGGLSGSPVFVVIEPFKYFDPGLDPFRPFSPDTRSFDFSRYELLLLGCIRGHFSDAEDKTWNSGIAMVTPIQEFAAILNSEELVKQRKETARKLKNAS